MIKDNIERAGIYYGISDNLRKGFEWIINSDTRNLSDGRYDISPDIYANVQTYITKDSASFEAHRKYIDIQYMISGEELCGVTDYLNCSSIEEYNELKDIEFLQSNSEEILYKLKTGEFFVFFPHDAHKPSIKVDDNKQVKKIVVKVKA